MHRSHFAAYIYIYIYIYVYIYIHIYIYIYMYMSIDLKVLVWGLYKTVLTCKVVCPRKIPDGSAKGKKSSAKVVV